MSARNGRNVRAEVGLVVDEGHVHAAGKLARRMLGLHARQRVEAVCRQRHRQGRERITQLRDLLRRHLELDAQRDVGELMRVKDGADRVEGVGELRDQGVARVSGDDGEVEGRHDDFVTSYLSATMPDV